MTLESMAAHNRIHSIWKAIREPFIIPQSICQHKGSATMWEVYDFNVAGCKMCGMLHLCVQGGTCPLEKNSEGHDICTITGFCTKMLNFSDKEYLCNVHFSSSSRHCASEEAEDTIQEEEEEEEEEPTLKSVQSKSGKRKALQPIPSSSSSSSNVNKKNRYRSWVHQKIQMNLHLPGGSAAATSAGRRDHHASSSADSIRCMIDKYIWDVLCSSSWIRSMKMEEQKLDAKKKSLLLKAFKQLKSARKNDSDMISIPEAVCMVACGTCSMSSRCSFFQDPEDKALLATRERICHWCCDAIHKHLCLMNSVCEGIITEGRLQNVTIGLLYLLRTGIVVHDMVVLPRLPILDTMLPLVSAVLPILNSARVPN